MRGIIVTGHGNFATGMSSAVELVAGAQENYIAVDFLQEDTPDTLKERLNYAIEELENCSEVIIFSDLIGGSPFKVSAELSMEKDEKIIVLSGTNLGMLVESVFSRETEPNLTDLIKSILLLGQNQVAEFLLPINSESVENEKES